MQPLFPVVPELAKIVIVSHVSVSLFLIHVSFFHVNCKPWKTEFLDSRKAHLLSDLSQTRARLRSLAPVPVRRAAICKRSL